MTRGFALLVFIAVFVHSAFTVLGWQSAWA